MKENISNVTKSLIDIFNLSRVPNTTIQTGITYVSIILNSI